jgi:hypothetical protein
MPHTHGIAQRRGQTRTDGSLCLSAQGIVVAVSNIMRSGGSPAYTPILPQICPVAPPPPGPQTQQLLDSIDAFYKEPSVAKLSEKCVSPTRLCSDR